MTTIVSGVVTNGVVVPNSPLPEGTRVEIRLMADAVPNTNPLFHISRDIDPKDTEKQESVTELALPKAKQPRTSLADWAEENSENWGNQLNSEDVIKNWASPIAFPSPS